MDKKNNPTAAGGAAVGPEPSRGSAECGLPQINKTLITGERRMRVFQLLFAVFLLTAASARGDPLEEPLQHEFLLMPSAVVFGTFDRQAPVTEVVDQVIQADMLVSLQKGPFKLFSEYLLSDHEGDLERFQLGWQASDETVIWLGRYHQPTSVWNHDHHHGQYLSTSISRPALDEWEDLGGILPQHFTGMLIESSKHAYGDWSLRTALGGGIAPHIIPDGLDPFDLVHPSSRHRQVGYQARASLHPGELTDTGFGILAASDELPVVGLAAPPIVGLDHVDLKLFGAFGMYAASDWKVLATAYHVYTRLSSPTTSTHDSFDIGYLEIERRFARDFTAFARWEDSSHAS
ncbi:MAG: hypothetical protein ACRETS_02880, partial [Steroidobacteraceae bacterium]